MSDFISRQAALNAMETWDKFGCDPDGKLVRYDDDKHYIPYVHYEDMVHVIKHLPSAQPEQRWIPCSERLPEEYGEYICTMENGQVQECGFVPENQRGLVDGWSTCEADGYKFLGYVDVLAWMPLPESYSGE